MAAVQRMSQYTWFHLVSIDEDDLESPVFHFEPGWGHPEGYHTKVASKVRQTGVQGRLRLVQSKELML